MTLKRITQTYTSNHCSVLWGKSVLENWKAAENISKTLEYIWRGFYQNWRHLSLQPSLKKGVRDVSRTSTASKILGSSGSTSGCYVMFWKSER